VNRIVQRALAAFVLAAVLVFVARLAWPNAEVFASDGSKRLVRLLASAAMLAPLIVAALYALGITRRLEPDNRARPAWMLLFAWLVSFAIGEAILVVYVQLLRVEPPIPSVGDGFFVAGYLLLVVGLAWFSLVYATSGLPLGSRYEPPLVAAAALLAFGLAGAKWLAPLANGTHSTAETTITLLYPALDAVVLVPTAVLARITSRFQGGRVWTIWATILAGFVSLAAADTMFAYYDLAAVTAAWLDSLTDITFVVGYTLIAFGAARQYELLH
jgi:hypothetical protein